MSNFRAIDRDTGFLLPPSIDEWLPETHLAWFVVEVIDGLDLSGMTRSYRGSGSASYHPGLLLGARIATNASGLAEDAFTKRVTDGRGGVNMDVLRCYPKHWLREADIPMNPAIMLCIAAFADEPTKASATKLTLATSAKRSGASLPDRKKHLLAVIKQD